jgi:hypothetical protein
LMRLPYQKIAQSRYLSFQATLNSRQDLDVFLVLTLGPCGPGFQVQVEKVLPSSSTRVPFV